MQSRLKSLDQKYWYSGNESVTSGLKTLTLMLKAGKFKLIGINPFGVVQFENGCKWECKSLSNIVPIQLIERKKRD